MLLSFLANRTGNVRAERQSFRWRGEGVSRIEGLSDTVFGFAITLLVVSLEVPKTSADLLETMLGTIPFIGSFTALFLIWRAQFEFFRRYGLEDEPTVRLTGVLLMGVLFAVYPVKFLTTFMLLTLPRAIFAGQADSLKQIMPLERLPLVIGLYGLGVIWIGAVFNRLYTHALRSHERLGLSDLEMFDTDEMRRRWGMFTLAGGIVVLWCTSVLAIGAHLRARDHVFAAVYYGGLVVLVLFAITRARLKRRRAEARCALVARVAEREAAARTDAEVLLAR
jgi:transmembrane protein TMEM174 (potassium channel)